MNVKELRIGNYVNRGYVVVELDSAGAGLVDSNDPDDIASYIFFTEDNLHPIPLTEEWLIRFRFKVKRCKDSDWEYIKSMVIIEKDLDKIAFSYGDCFLNHIEHVHQLQNLYFSLTNKEITIKDAV